jgi:hypothetical protein
MCSGGRKGAALAAEPPGVHWNHPDRNVPLRRAGPDQRNKPADDRPASKQVHEEDSHKIGFVPRQYGREEVHNRGEKKEGHVFTPFRTSSTRSTIYARPYIKIRWKPQDCSVPRASHFRSAVEFFAKRTGLNCLGHISSFQPESCDSWSTFILHHPNSASKKDVTAKSTARAAQEKPNGLQVGGTRSQILMRKKHPGQANNNGRDHEERET